VVCALGRKRPLSHTRGSPRWPLLIVSSSSGPAGAPTPESGQRPPVRGRCSSWCARPPLLRGAAAIPLRPPFVGAFAQYTPAPAPAPVVHPAADGRVVRYSPPPLCSGRAPVASQRSSVRAAPWATRCPARVGAKSHLRPRRAAPCRAPALGRPCSGRPAPTGWPCGPCSLSRAFAVPQTPPRSRACGRGVVPLGAGRPLFARARRPGSARPLSRPLQLPMRCWPPVPVDPPRG
jgi:hypothetical protein